MSDGEIEEGVVAESPSKNLLSKSTPNQPVQTSISQLTPVPALESKNQQEKKILPKDISNIARPSSPPNNSIKKYI